MFCKNCGSENAEGVKFCTSCGSPMGTDTAPEVVQTQEAPVTEAAETNQPNEATDAGAEQVNSQPMGESMAQGAAQGNMPGNMPGGVPGGMPAYISGAPVPGQPQQGGQFQAANGMPTTQGSMPGATSGMPTTQGSMPGNMPGSMPNNMPGSMPGGAPGGMPAYINGAPVPGQPQQGGQFQAANGMPTAQGGMPGNMPGNMPNNMPGGMPTNLSGAPIPGQPMGQPQPGMYGGMPGARPMQTGPMYQMPPMQAVPPAQPKKGNGGVKALIIIIVVLLLLCVGVLAAIGISKSAKQRKIDEYILNAEEYRQKEDYSAAVSGYQDALEMDEDNDEAIDGLTEAYIEWANSLADEGKYAEALDILNNADKRANRKAIKKAIEEIETAMLTASSGWSDEDFVFTSDSQSVTVDLGYGFRVDTYYEMSYLTDYYEAYLTDYFGGDEVYDDISFRTNRGLTPGMTFQDYISLYGLQPGYVAWEVILSDDVDDYTAFSEYSGGSAYEIYDYYYEKYDYEYYVNAWMDLGYCKENGEWRLLADKEVRDIWFCEAPLSDYDEVVILSVNVYKDDMIGDISLVHLNYDREWVVSQNWE